MPEWTILQLSPTLFGHRETSNLSPDQSETLAGKAVFGMFQFSRADMSVMSLVIFVVAAFHHFRFRVVSAGVIRRTFVYIYVYVDIRIWIFGCKATYGELIYNVRAWSVQYLTDFGRCIGEGYFSLLTILSL